MVRDLAVLYGFIEVEITCLFQGCISSTVCCCAVCLSSNRYSVSCLVSDLLVRTTGNLVSPREQHALKSAASYVAMATRGIRQNGRLFRVLRVWLIQHSKKRGLKATVLLVVDVEQNHCGSIDVDVGHFSPVKEKRKRTSNHHGLDIPMLFRYPTFQGRVGGGHR